MIEPILIIMMLSLFYLFHVIKKQSLVSVPHNKNGRHDDNEQYMVQNRPDKQNAANMIHQIKLRIIKLIHLLEKHDTTPFDTAYITNAKKRLETTVFRESMENSKNTSYSINKGEEIVLCLRSQITYAIHDINILMYVAIHELAHVICPEIGHTPLFNTIFRHILEVATLHNLYRYENYTRNNREYCGITVSQNILNKSKE